MQARATGPVVTGSTDGWAGAAARGGVCCGGRRTGVAAHTATPSLAPAALCSNRREDISSR
jgi:hypothetical protein